MRALILGGEGQVGRAVAAAAPTACTVHALGRGQCDITSLEMLNRVIQDVRPDIVFNAAAYTAVDAADDHATTAAAVNAEGPRLVAEACTSAGATLVHFSTDYVFDGRSSRPYRPDDAVAPLSVYGRTKADGEAAVRAVLPDALIVRTSWVYAPGSRNFVSTMLRLMAERGAVRVVDDQIGSPTCAAALAAASWRLAQRHLAGTWHVTDAGVASWYDLAVAIAEEAHALGLLASQPDVAPVRTADFPAKAARPAFSVLDKSATWAELGSPASHWRVNLRSCLKEIAARG